MGSQNALSYLLGMNGGLSGLGGTGGMGGLSGLGGLAGMSGMGGMGGLAGLSGLGGMGGLAGMNGLGGMGGLAGMSGVPGMSGLGGLSGMGGMQGLGGSLLGGEGLGDNVGQQGLGNLAQMQGMGGTPGLQGMLNPGLALQRNCMCPRNYDPVCSVTGQTFANECLLRCGGGIAQMCDGTCPCNVQGGIGVTGMGMAGLPNLGLNQPMMGGLSTGVDSPMDRSSDLAPAFG